MSSDSEALTENQSRVLDFLKQKIELENHVPSIREIGEHLGIVSPNGVAGLLKRLEAKGMIKRTKNRARSITLTSKTTSTGLPLVGQVAAGPMSTAFEQTERFDFDSLASGADFVLEVSGDSMIDAQIAPGDFVIVRKTNVAQRGDIVVVRDEDNEATLKYWFPERNRIRLQPANRNMKPIFRKSVEVLGVVTALARKY